jgi:hypothetical protein
MKNRLLSRVGLALLGSCLLASTAWGDPQYKNTEITLNAPVEIPGQVLMPGKYVMKVLNPFEYRTIVRIYDPSEQHLYAMVRAVPSYRTNLVDHPVITFEERAANSPEALKDWFPSDDYWGVEFVYPQK